MRSLGSRGVRPALVPWVVMTLALAGRAGGATVTVTSTADTTGGPACTLRDAIAAVNGNVATGGCPAGGASDVLAFAIPAGTDPGCVVATGVCTIRPATQLPFFTSLVDVNGFTQAGAAANTNAGSTYPSAQALNAQVRIELDGSLTSNATGLVFNSGSTGSRVRGLAIHGFHTAINLNAGGVLVTGNYIGTKADGVTTTTLTYGVGMVGSGNVIGGSSAADRNLITGAGGGDVFVNGGSTTQITGNLIGTDRTGTIAVSSGSGVYIRGTTGAATGSAISSNVIAGVAGPGIYLLGTASTGITGNTIGIAVGGAALGNSWGVIVQDNDAAPSASTVLSGNGIANSTFADGISVTDSANVAGSPGGVNVDGTNAIWGNTGLGIDLRPTNENASQVTANDALDADAGPNGLQNYPVITSAVLSGSGAVLISYTLDSAPNATYGLTAWANPDCSAASQREARYPSGQVSPNVQTDGTGHTAGTVTIPAPLPAGWGLGSGIVMTARDTGTSSTSELSACVAVTTAVPVELQTFVVE